MSPDSIVPGAGNPQALNRYSYVLNNPLRYIDPTGHRYEDGWTPNTDGTRPAGGGGGGGGGGAGGGAGGGGGGSWQQPEFDPSRVPLPIGPVGAGPRAVQGAKLGVKIAILAGGLALEGLRHVDTPEVDVPDLWYSDDDKRTVSQERRTHILEGDETGGGHRAGTGISGKSEFPADWSDDDIIGAIEDVANDPNSTEQPGRGARVIVDGTRDGVDIRVVVEGNEVITGFPTNRPRNP